MQKSYSASAILSAVLFFSLILSSGQAPAQTSGEITTKDGFSKVTIKDGNKTITTLPVMPPDAPLNAVIPGGRNENVEQSGWVLQQTVSGVVKAISFVDPNVGYMAAELGVVYKTTNGGADWQNVLNLGFPYYWYGVHTFTPLKVLIAGFNNTTGDGIMRWTYDGGATWSDDIIVAPAPFNWLMGLDFADSLHGLAVGSILSAGSVFITDNGGTDTTDWTQGSRRSHTGMVCREFHDETRRKVLHHRDQLLQFNRFRSILGQKKFHRQHIRRGSILSGRPARMDRRRINITHR